MIITIKKIKELSPCKDRLNHFIKHYPNFRGTHDEFLASKKLTYGDKLWVCLRLMGRIDVEVFAIDCAVVAKDSDAAGFAAAFVVNSCDEFFSTPAPANYITAYITDYTSDFATRLVEEKRQLDALSYLMGGMK